MKLFEILKDTVGPLMDGEKAPPHVGEVMNLWSYLHDTELINRLNQICYNTTEDPELKAKLKDLIVQVHNPIILELKEFMSKEGIPLPDATPEKPIAGLPEHVHPGIKLIDEEIANLIAYGIVERMKAATMASTNAVRVDIALLFAKFQMMHIQFSITFKPLMEKRGWINVPIYYNP